MVAAKGAEARRCVWASRFTWTLYTPGIAPGLADAVAAPLPDGAEVQVLPSGPGFEGEGARRLLLATIYAARDEIVLTTPSFVPDEPLFLALEAAAQRGVTVTVIVPAPKLALTVAPLPRL